MRGKIAFENIFQYLDLMQPPVHHTILFFSSDITALFKKDILSVLSLPRGYCIHFRYSEDDITSAIMQRLPNVINREGLIVYTKDNNPSIEINQRQVKFFPVRKVLISNFRKDDQTKLRHFNLELGDFIECEIDYPAEDMRPPYKFVADGAIKNYSVKSWLEKIESLAKFDNSLTKKLFYNVRIFEDKEESGSFLETPFDTKEESSFFKLCESKSYILDLSIYLTENDEKEFENYECKFEYDKKDILISNPSSIIIGSQKDNRRFKLITKSIEYTQAFDYLKIISAKKVGATTENFYETVIRFNIMKSSTKALMFTLLFLMNLTGTAWFAYIIARGNNMYLAVIPLIMVVASALGQYYFYNKSK